MPYDRERAIQRNVEFMSDPNITGTMIRINGFGKLDLPEVDAVETLDLSKDMSRYCSQVLERFLRFRDAHDQFDDDWIPALKPYLGIAEHTCFLGGEVSYGGNTSYHHPVIDDINDWKQLHADINIPHYKALLEGMAYFKEKSTVYDFYASLRGSDGPMDIANAVRGNDLLYDFCDEPETVDKLMEFCVDAVRWHFKNQFPLASVVNGGYISGMETWMPANSIGHIAEDASCLCSPAMYERFGLPYTMKLLEPYDYALMHVHSLGRTRLPLITKMDKIGTYQLTSDPNQPEAIDVYKQYDNLFEKKVVMLDMTLRQIKDNQEFLKGRKTIINIETDSVYEAQMAIELARSI